MPRATSVSRCGWFTQITLCATSALNLSSRHSAFHTHRPPENLVANVSGTESWTSSTTFVPARRGSSRQHQEVREVVDVNDVELASGQQT